jgi:hypothetical protein
MGDVFSLARSWHAKINESKKINGLPFFTIHITQKEKKLVSTFK